MCKTREQAKKKIDRLIEAIDRLSDLLERREAAIGFPAGETEESFGEVLFRELRKWPTFDKPIRPSNQSALVSGPQST